MLKNREFRIKVVKTPDSDAPAPIVINSFTPEKINRIAKDQVRNTTIVVGSAFAAYKVLTTISDIAVITAKAKIR